jgi:hypothetical protein
VACLSGGRPRALRRDLRSIETFGLREREDRDREIMDREAGRVVDAEVVCGAPGVSPLGGPFQAPMLRPGMPPSPQ